MAGHHRFYYYLTGDRRLEDIFEELGYSPKSIAGPHRSGWILMDYGDIIINVFNPELRERYNLESVWGDCSFIEIEE